VTSKTLLSGGCVLTLGTKTPNFTHADVLIDGDTVTEVGSGIRARDAELVDATDTIVMPGFVDTHRHAWTSLFRNLGEGPWAGAGPMPSGIGEHLQPEDVYAATLIGLLGAAEAGITTVVDWSHDRSDAGFEAAALQAKGPALELGHHPGLVRGQEHRRALDPDVPDDVEDLIGHVVVEVAGGLVGQEERGRLDQRARERDPLRLTLGELVGIGLGAPGEADGFEARERQRRDLAPGRAEHPEHEGDVVEHGPAGEELGVLENDPDGPAQVGDLPSAETDHVDPRDLDLPVRGHLVPVEEPEESGLAGPAPPAQNGELGLVDSERDVGESLDSGRPIAIDLRHALKPYHGDDGFEST